tara:strand:- start:2626 stop:2871 length:246 start_codon:yes stop_codon:yes gene_type:complete
MTSVFIFVIFSLSFLVLFYGMKDSPRGKLISIYVKKKELSEKARLSGNQKEYSRLRRESQDAYEMIRMLDEPFSNYRERKW